MAPKVAEYTVQLGNADYFSNTREALCLLVWVVASRIESVHPRDGVPNHLEISEDYNGFFGARDKGRPDYAQGSLFRVRLCNREARGGRFSIVRKDGQNGSRNEQTGDKCNACNNPRVERTGFTRCHCGGLRDRLGERLRVGCGRLILIGKRRLTLERKNIPTLGNFNDDWVV